MYTKYHTEAIVLKSYEVGEADRVYHLFTRELGMVYAKSKSTRKHTSKLKHSLQTLARVDVSLIRTRDASSWRITNAQVRQHMFYALRPGSRELRVAVRLARLLRHLVGTERQDRRLYDTVSSALSYLNKGVADSHELSNVEIVTVLRMLHTLGYVSSPAFYGYILGATHLSDMHLHEAERNHRRIIKDINRALRVA